MLPPPGNVEIKALKWCILVEFSSKIDVFCWAILPLLFAFFGDLLAVLGMVQSHCLLSLLIR